jgi:hypothetical protein
VDAGLGGFGQGNVEADGGGFLLSGEVGFGPLLGKWGKLGPLGADEVESGGAADFIESLAEELFLTFDGILLEEGKKFTFLGATGSDLGEGGHGVASDLF